MVVAWIVTANTFEMAVGLLHGHLLYHFGNGSGVVAWTFTVTLRKCSGVVAWTFTVTLWKWFRGCCLDIYYNTLKRIQWLLHGHLPLTWEMVQRLM